MTTGKLATVATLLVASILLAACLGSSGNAYQWRSDWGCRVESGKTVCPARTGIHRIEAATPGRSR